MKVGVVNSDRRMQQVYFNLSSTYDTCLINTFTNMDKLKAPDVLVLPLKGLKDDGTLKLNGEEIALTRSFWESMGEDHIVFAGMHHPFLDTLNCKKYYYMEDHDLAKKNAILTSEGVLFLLIDHTSKSILELNIDVIGYGTCGQEIVAWLRALGIEVRIIRREKASTDDEHVLSISKWKSMPCGDVIINTAPDRIIDRELMARWIEKPLIIDIASGEQIDASAAALCGIQYIKAGTLPAMFAWVSAGNIIADYVRGKLEHGE